MVFLSLPQSTPLSSPNQSKRMNRFTLPSLLTSTLLAIGVLGGCADSDLPPQTAEQEAAISSGGTSELASPTLPTEALATLVRKIAPVKARDGRLLFSDARLQTPQAAALLTQRLLSGSDSEPIRRALIAALPKTQGRYAQTVLSLLPAEKSPLVRADLIDSLRLSKEGVLTLKSLRLGMQDTSAIVRSRAAYTIAHRPDGKELSSVLLKGISDKDASVQAHSARALGYLGVTTAFDAVLPLLQSGSADVRLEALRALARMDKQRAATLTALETLATDRDSRIQTAVVKTRKQAY